MAKLADIYDSRISKLNANGKGICALLVITDQLHSQKIDGWDFYDHIFSLLKSACFIHLKGKKLLPSS